MGWTTEESKILSIIPHVTGLFSFFGSSTIIGVILRNGKEKLGKPYYRLLFAMCIFDIFASISHALSTWPIPEGSPGVYDPKGTTQTCSAQAFFVQASIASPIYNFMLSIYFLLRVKYGLSEEHIGKRIEPLMHIIAVTFGLGTSFVCLGLNLFNVSTLWCWINASPVGCDQSYANNGETNCERGDNAEIYRWVIFFGPLWFCIVGCMVIMFMIFMSIREQENKLKKHAFKTQRGNEVTHMGEEYDKKIQKKKKEDEKRRHAHSRKVAHQGLRFVGVFYLTWAFATVNRVLQASIGHSYFWLMCLHTIFVPMQGFFNFLVFIYPIYLRAKANSAVTATVHWFSTKKTQRRGVSDIVRDEEEIENETAMGEEKVEEAEEVELEVVSPIKSMSLMRGTFDDTTTELR